MISMTHRLERKSVTDKLPLTVRSHVRRNITKGRDIKIASDNNTGVKLAGITAAS